MDFVIKVTEDNNPPIVLDAMAGVDLNSPDHKRIIGPGRLVHFEFTPQNFESSYGAMFALTKVGRINMIIEFEGGNVVPISMHSIIAEYDAKTNIWTVKDGIRTQ